MPQSGPPDEVGHWVAVWLSPVFVPEELGVVLTPPGGEGGAGGAAGTSRGKA